MATDSATLPANQWPIGANRPEPRPTKIHAFVLKVALDYGGNVRFFYSAYAPYEGDVERVAQEFADHKLPASAGDVTALPMFTREPCYFILCLHPEHNWRFRKTSGAVTTKYQNPKASFSDLRLMAPSDPRIAEALRERVDGCQVAFFAVDPKGQETSDPVNFHVDIVQDERGERRILPLVIDPDIKHPGDNG